MVRPQDLRLPYSKTDPRIVFHDYYWSMHPRLDPASFIFPGWEDEEIFGFGSELLFGEDEVGFGCRSSGENGIGSG